MSDDSGLLVVSPETFDLLLDMIENPPEPTPALRALFAKHRERWPLKRGTLTLEDGKQHQVIQDATGSDSYRIVK